MQGDEITIKNKALDKGKVYGGLLFGFGWAMTGACPGPLFAILGTGAFGILAVIFGALAGTWFYGLIREKLPH